MNGWIIKNNKGSHLTKNMFWCPHDKDEDAYVFTDDEVQKIKRISQTWDIKPAWKMQAVYENGMTRIVADVRAI